MPRGAKASPPCVRPVCRRCGTLRGRIAHATLFSGTRPRCRTRQEWKYTGTRGGRLTHWSALARFGVPEMRPCGRVAHYMDTLPDVTPFILDNGNRGHLARRDCPGGTDRRPTPDTGYSAAGRRMRSRRIGTSRAPLRFRIPDNGAGCVHITITSMDRRKCRAHSKTSVPAPDSLRPHRSRGARRGRKVRSMAESMSSAANLGPFRRARGEPPTSR